METPNETELVVTDFNLLPKYLVSSEVAALARLSERQVFHLAACGEIPCFKPGGKKDAGLRFDKDKVREWIEQPYQPRKKREKVAQESATA